MPQYSKAQIFDSKVKVDTLSLSERISLRTNVVDWTLLTPNLGVEFDVRSTNWNRWAVGLSFKSKWNTPATFKNRIFYNNTEVRVDFRNYWRTRQINNKLNAHTGFIDRLFSCRRRVVKHPTTTYYRGAYASFSDFSVKLGKTGRQGKAASVGITYGIIKPLYTFRTGNTLDLDLGFDAGFVMAKTEKFYLDREDNCYRREGAAGSWKFVPFPMPTQLRVGFVYRFGKYPITKKYRWRYDVDERYQFCIDSIANKRYTDAFNKHIQDSIQNKIISEFWQVYDSVSVVNADKAEKARIENARLKAEADAKKAEADAKKAEADAKKAAEEKERLKAKEEKPAEESAPAADGTAPATEETAPATEETAPSAEESAPAAEESAPSAEKSAPATEEASPSTEEASPSTEEASPSTEEAAPIEETTPQTETSTEESTETEERKEASDEQ